MSDIIDNALARADARAAREVRVDYAKLNSMVKRQRTALRRVAKTGDANKIAAVVKSHVAEWDAPGAMWPDDWADWERTLNDALPWQQQVDIRDL